MLPELDFGVLGGGRPAGRARLAAAIAAAGESAGGLVAVGHGVSAVEPLLGCARDFFSLPQDDRDAIHVNAAGRGYTPLGAGGKRGFLPDAKEAFQANTEQPATLTGDAARFSGENQWPRLDDFRQTVTSGLTELREFGRTILELLATGMQLKPDTFAAALQPGMVTLRLHHYPPAADRSPARFGAAPHTDFGALGLVAESPPAGGLEGRDRAGRWLRVSAPAGALIVIVGELLAWWSGGRLLALPHRVPSPKLDSRFSVAAFVNPSPDAWLRPLGSGDQSELSTAAFIARLVDERAAGSVSVRPS